MPLGGLVTAGAVLGVASGVGKTIFGANELKKTKAELGSLKMPGYQIQPEYYTNERLSAALAQGGLTQQAKDYYTDESGRGLGAGISAVLRTGGSPNMVGDLLDKYNQGIQQISVADAEKQQGNIRQYMDTAKTLAGQKTMQWAINEYQPYQNKLKELTQRRAAAYQNVFGGIGDVASSFAAIGTGQQNAGLGSSGNGLATGTETQQSQPGVSGVQTPGMTPSQFTTPQIF